MVFVVSNANRAETECQMFEWSTPANPQRLALRGGSIMPNLGIVEHAGTVEETGRWM